jgi:hypothetical protein
MNLTAPIGLLIFTLIIGCSEDSTDASNLTADICQVKKAGRNIYGLDSQGRISTVHFYDDPSSKFTYLTEYKYSTGNAEVSSWYNASTLSLQSTKNLKLNSTGLPTEFRTASNFLTKAFYYNSAGQLSYYVYKSSTVAENDSVAIKYDPAGKNVIEEKSHSFNSTTKKWEFRRTATYKYDDKINPFFKLIGGSSTYRSNGDIFAPYFFSQNNMIFEDGDILSYTYNSKGYPIVVNQNATGFVIEYDCK